jgi:hypothetical protein
MTVIYWRACFASRKAHAGGTGHRKRRELTAVDS